MGVVVKRYIDILIIIITCPYSTCISSFFGSSIHSSFFKCFFHTCVTYKSFPREYLTYYVLRPYYDIFEYLELSTRERIFSESIT